MKRLALLSAALLLPACSETAPERTPTAPAAPSFSRAAVPTPRGISTVCLSYTTQLANTHEKLEKLEKEQRLDATIEAKLTKKVESLEKLVTDACR